MKLNERELAKLGLVRTTTQHRYHPSRPSRPTGPHGLDHQRSRCTRPVRVSQNSRARVGSADELTAPHFILRASFSALSRRDRPASKSQTPTQQCTQSQSCTARLDLLRQTADLVYPISLALQGRAGRPILRDALPRAVRPVSARQGSERDARMYLSRFALGESISRRLF